MNSLNRILFYIAICVATMFAAGCSDDCIENRNALPLAGFYYADKPTEVVTLDSLEVYGVGAPEDSILSRARVVKSQLYLPFRIDSDVTQYVFEDKHKRAEGKKDVVTFRYARTPRFVSAGCGVSYYFSIESITTQGVLIDSVVCPQGYIDNANIENLKIFFKSEEVEL